MGRQERGERHPAHRRHRDRGWPRERRARLASSSTAGAWTRSSACDAYNMQATVAVRRAAAGARGPRPRAWGSRPATRRSPSRSLIWAASWPRAASASSPRCTAASRTWSSGSRPSSRTAAICRIKNVPRRAAGPDIRHVVIGNEGALCFITEVTVKLFPYFPENNRFLGLDAQGHGHRVRGAARGHGQRLQAVGGARLRPRRRRHPLLTTSPSDDCVLLFMAEGAAGIAKATADGIQEIVDRHPECTQVDSTLHRDLVQRPLLGREQDHRRGRAHPPDAAT